MEIKDPQVECRTLKHDTCDIDLSGWEITCTEFIPRGRRQTSSTTNANTVIRARTRSPVHEKMDHARCTTPKKSSVSMLVVKSLGNKQPGGPCKTKCCFIFRSPNHFARDCSRARQPNQGHGSSRNNKNKSKR
jgi:hypothetical protein